MTMPLKVMIFTCVSSKRGRWLSAGLQQLVFCRASASLSGCWFLCAQFTISRVEFHLVDTSNTSDSVFSWCGSSVSQVLRYLLDCTWSASPLLAFGKHTIKCTILQRHCDRMLNAVHNAWQVFEWQLSRCCNYVLCTICPECTLFSMFHCLP